MRIKKLKLNVTIKKTTIIQHVIILLSLFNAHFIIHKSNLLAISFLPLSLIFIIGKFDSRLFFKYAFVLIFFVAALSAFYFQNLANIIALYAYWLLVIGSICVIIEEIR